MKKTISILLVVIPIMLIILFYSYPIIYPIPVVGDNYEIVFWDEGRIGFISSDGNALEYRYIKPSIATTHLDLFRYYTLGNGITWGINGSELVAGFSQYNPYIQEPIIIENSGTIRSCLGSLSINSLGRSHSVDDNRIITSITSDSTDNNPINQLIILNLQSCQIEAVLYETPETIYEAVQLPDGWLAVWVGSPSFSGIRIISPSNTVVQEFIDGSYPNYSQAMNSIIFSRSDGIYAFDFSSMSLDLLFPGDHIRCPSVSPNGEQIVYEADSGINIFTVATGEVVQILDHGNCPDWRP